VKLGYCLVFFYHFALEFSYFSAKSVCISVLWATIAIQLVLKLFDGIYLHSEGFIFLGQLEGDILQFSLQSDYLLLQILRASLEGRVVRLILLLERYALVSLPISERLVHLLLLLHPWLKQTNWLVLGVTDRLLLCSECLKLLSEEVELFLIIVFLSFETLNHIFLNRIS